MADGLLTADYLQLELAKLRNALRDIAYVGQNGSPVDAPDAVAKWCANRAKEALGMVPDAVSTTGEPS